jgi:hypothetical protein
MTRHRRKQHPELEFQPRKRGRPKRTREEDPECDDESPAAKKVKEEKTEDEEKNADTNAPTGGGQGEQKDSTSQLKTTEAIPNEVLAPAFERAMRPTQLPPAAASTFQGNVIVGKANARAATHLCGSVARGGQGEEDTRRVRCSTNIETALNGDTLTVVLSWLDPTSLLRARLVSRTFRDLASDASSSFTLTAHGEPSSLRGHWFKGNVDVRVAADGLARVLATALPRANAIRVLKCDHELTDAGVVSLAACPRLTSLDARDSNHITPATAARLLACPTLKSLCISPFIPIAPLEESIGASLESVVLPCHDEWIAAALADSPALRSVTLELLPARVDEGQRERRKRFVQTNDA